MGVARILSHQPLLAICNDIVDTPHVAEMSLATMMDQPPANASDALQLLEPIPNAILTIRLKACLAITQPTLILLSSTSTAFTHTLCRDGVVITLPVRTPSFAHIARTRPLPPHEQTRREALLTHPHLSQCIALATQHHLVSRAHVAEHVQTTTAHAATLLKSLAPLFYASDHTCKYFIYDGIAHRAIMAYRDEASLISDYGDPRQQLPDLVRRFSNHHGKISQLPVRLSDREQVLHYLAQLLPDTPMNESQINTAILRHVAFDDYATARRDMVDLGFVMRTADGRVYQRIIDVAP